jgi:hypothetical protein
MAERLVPLNETDSRDSSMMYEEMWEIYSKMDMYSPDEITWAKDTMEDGSKEIWMHMKEYSKAHKPHTKAYIREGRRLNRVFMGIYHWPKNE